jgi:DNA-binding NtrC family response regulator
VNWKSEAIDRLRRYESMKAAIQSIPDEIQRLEMEATSIKAVRTDKLPVKSGAADRNDTLLDNMVRREELRWALKQAKLWVKTTERGLRELTPEDKLVLHRLFISNERGNIERLCQELGCEQSTVYRKRDQAIYRFTIALYGFVETQFERSSVK